MLEEGYWYWYCFSGVRLGDLLPVKGNLNASVYNDILDYAKAFFLFQHDCGPGARNALMSLVWKNLTDSHRVLT